MRPFLLSLNRFVLAKSQRNSDPQVLTFLIVTGWLLLTVTLSRGTDLGFVKGVMACESFITPCQVIELKMDHV